MSIQTNDQNISNFIINDISALSVADQRLLARNNSQFYKTNNGNNIYLRDISTAAPSTPVAGDMYYNTTTNLIYMYLQNSNWDSGKIPDKEKIYINLSNNQTYYYNELQSSLVGIINPTTVASYNTLLDKPVLNTNNSDSQTPNATEILQNTVNLHKISKTGDFTDLNNNPFTISSDSVTTVKQMVMGNNKILSFYVQSSWT